MLGPSSQAFLYDKTLSLHSYCLHPYYPQNATGKTYFLHELHSSSAFALEKDVSRSAHHSCGPRSAASAQPEAISPCPSDTDTNTMLVPLTSLQLCPSPVLPSRAQPSSWNPGLASAHPCPHGGARCPGLVSCSLAGMMSRCPAGSLGTQHRFGTPGSCWTSLAHRCHDSVVGSAPGSFSMIQ